MQEAFAACLGHAGQVYPKEKHKRVVFWKLVRRRATHNRFFENLNGSIRASLCYFLSDSEEADSEPGCQALPPPWQPDSISGFVN